MKYSILTLLIVVTVVVGCQDVSDNTTIVNTSSEIIYNSVVSEQIRADEITYFGISFGASPQEVVAVHGEPDERSEFAFGRTVNLEYSLLGANQTNILYHFDRGELESVLIPSNFDSFAYYDSIIGNENQDMYAALGVPTRSQDLQNRNRVFIYDELGYEVYSRGGEINRIYFTTPNRGIEPVGQDITRNESNQPPQICIQVVTYAQNETTCAQFPTPCDVPDDWHIITEPTQQQQEVCQPLN